MLWGIQNDPLQHAEKIVKELHDTSGKYTRPVPAQYPLLFLFLVVFSFATILHSFQIVAGRIELFDWHPTYLILIGVLVLFFTGMLYKTLKAHKNK